MPVKWNYSVNQRVLAASLPMLIIGVILGYLLINSIQTQRALYQEQQNLKTSIELQQTIMLLGKVRDLAMIAIQPSQNSKNKQTIVGTIEELKQLILDKMSFIASYYKNFTEQAQVQAFSNAQNKINILLAEITTKQKAREIQAQYDQVIGDLVQVDLNKTGVQPNRDAKNKLPSHVLSANHKIITALIENIRHLRVVVARWPDSQTSVNAIKDEIMMSEDRLEATHRQFTRQYTSLPNKSLLTKSGSLDAAPLEAELAALEKMTRLLINGTGQKRDIERYLEVAAKANETAVNFYKEISIQNLAIDRQKMAEVAGRKKEIVLLSLIIVVCILVLSAIYFNISKKMLTKLTSLNKALARSENNVRNIIELLPHVVVLQDRDGQVLMANRAFREFTRKIEAKKGGQIPGNNSASNLLDKFFNPGIEKLNPGELSVTRREWFVGDDGEKRIVQISSIPYPLNDSSSAVLTVMTDITEIYKVRELQEISGIGYWEWDISNNKINFSEKFYETTGIVPDSDADNFTAYLNNVVTEDRQRVMQEFFEAKQTKRAIDIEHRVLKNDGGESTVRLIGRIYQSGMDDTVHMAGSIQDITIQKQAADALKQSELKYRKLVENLSDAYFFYSYNIAGELTYISPSVETVLGYSAREVYGSQVMNPISMRRKPQTAGNTASSSDRDNQSNFELAINHRDGSLKYLEVSEVAVYSSSGEISGYDGIAHDVTENKYAQAELMESERRLRELASHLQEVRENERASIAHDIHDEIGGYLMALKMDISLLSKRLDKTETQFNSRFQSMTQLLDVAIESTRRMVTNLRPSILDELGLLEALEWQLNDVGIRYGLVTDFNLGYQAGNLRFQSPEHSVSIFRMFQEILNNIVKHAKAETISVFAAVNANAFVLSVSDDGVGMDKKESVKKGSYGILGMQERIKKMDGMMLINSNLGGGTTIIIRIPFREEYFCYDNDELTAQGVSGNR